LYNNERVAWERYIRRNTRQAAIAPYGLVGRIQGCDPPNDNGQTSTYGGTRPWFRLTALRFDSDAGASPEAFPRRAWERSN